MRNLCKRRSILFSSILRVLVSISHDSVDNLLVEPRPVLPRSHEPEENGNNDHKCEDRKRVIEIISRDRQVLGKAEDYHHPSGIRQRKGIDRNAICSEGPAGTWYAIHQSGTEHATDGDRVRRKQRQ